MPQHTHHPLINLVLLWTTVLSIIQAVFIIYFFTAGHHRPNSSAVTPERVMQFQPTNTPSVVPSPLPTTLLLGKGKMLTFSVKDTDLNWLGSKTDTGLVTDGNVLTIKKDGYYFLNLQVTLCSPCERPYTVNVMREEDLLLQGWINTSTCSTGTLSKVTQLFAAGTLNVTINPKPDCIISDEYGTHLDIIYMLKP